MPQSLICPQGHRWESVRADDAAPPSCPICGTAPSSVAATIDEAQNTAAYVAPQDGAAEKPAAEQVSIPGYEILGVLGRGGMGVVYKARHKKLKRLVALKMILAGAHAGPQDLERFRLEAESVARLQHVNIVQIHEIGEHDGKPYFSLEYVDGGSLRDKLAGTPLPGREAAKLIEILARAMQAAHQHGVIHRDLKPANILLGKDEGGRMKDESSQSVSSLILHPSSLIPKITDFGLAKQLGQDSGQTHSGQILGTPSYMAPEQAAGNIHAVGPATDIYALGAILYELLTGRPPFRAASVLDTLELVRTQEPVPPSQLQPKTPRDLETICLKCLQKDAAKRYASAADLADDVLRFLNGEPIHARPVGPLERFGRWCRRNPVVAGLSATVFVVLLTGTAVAWYLAVDAMWEKDRADANALSEQQARKDSDKNAAEAKANETKEKLARADADKNAAEAKANETKEKLARADADKNAAEAIEATRLARQRLYGAKLAEAKAGRWSGRRGQRFDSLQALGEAARLAEELQLGAKDILELRNEAIACMGLVDLRVDRQWPGYPPGTDGTGIAFDSQVEHYALMEKGQLTVRRLADHKEMVRITGMGNRNNDQMFLRFSPDGRFLVARGDPALKVPTQVFDLHVPKLIFKIPAGGAWHYSDTDFSPDSRLLAAGHADGSIGLYEAGSGKVVKRVSNGPVATSIRFHPEGHQLAVCRGTQVQILDINTGKIVQEKRYPGGTTAVSWGAGGRFLAFAVGDQAYVWAVPTDKIQAVCKGHQRAVLHTVFNHAGDLLATTSWDGTTRLWEPWTGRLLLTTPGYATEFSRDDRWLGFGWVGSTVGRWQLATGRECRRFFGHDPKWGIYSLDINSGGLMASSAGYDNTGDGVRLWDIPTAKEIAVLPGGISYAVLFQPSGNSLVTSGSVGLQRWSIQRDKEPKAEALRIGPPTTFPLPDKSAPGRAALSADGRTLAVVHAQKVMVLDLEGQRPARFLNHAENQLSLVGISPDGKWVGSSAWHGSVLKLWDAQQGKWVRNIPARRGQPAFSPDNQWLVIGSREGFAFYDTNSWELKARIQPEDISVSAPSMAFSRDGKLLALLHSLRSCKMIDPTSKNEYATFSAPDAELLTLLRLSPDGSLLAATANHVILVWDLRLIRAQLKDMGLDWYAPPYPQPAPMRSAPIRIEIDLGEFTAPAIKPLPAFGKIVFSQAGKLDAKDPLDKSGRRQEVHTFKMNAGNVYTIDAQSKEFDTYLRLADAAGKMLREDDDGGGDLNARIVFRPANEAAYRIAVTSYKADVTGAFTLTIREAPAPPPDSNVLELAGHAGTISALGFSPDGTRLATGDSKAARVWDAQSGKLLFTLDAMGPVYRASFGAGARLLTIGNKETAVRLWDAQSGKAMPALPELKGIVHEAVLTPDGKRLVCFDKSGALTVFDPATAKVLSATAAYDPKFFLNGLAVSPDGSKVCYALGKAQTEDPS